MIAALKYEWLRIRTIRSTWWLSAIAVVFGVGLSFLVAMGTSFSAAGSQPLTGDDQRMLGPAIITQFASFGAPHFVVYILAMIGVFAWGHEYRHGMIRATLTALSSRTASWAAKYVVVAVWTLVTALVIMLGSALSGWLWLRDDGVSFATSGVAGTIGRTLVYTLIFVWIATAFTSLIRNQTAALVLVFIWPLAVENVIGLVFRLVPGLRDHSGVTRFLPFGAGGRILNRFQKADSVFGDPLSAWGGTVIFGGITLVLVLAGLALFQKRDA